VALVLSRHRISSARIILLWCIIPMVGKPSITCDTDHLDDNWIPRAANLDIWRRDFGT